MDSIYTFSRRRKEGGKTGKKKNALNEKVKGWGGEFTETARRRWH